MTAAGSVVHVVVTPNFAGVERHVCDLAVDLAGRSWDVAVVGGDPARMRAELGQGVSWLPGASAVQAAASLRRLGSRDVCHVHMTIAEAVGVATRRLHHAPVVATRHFAAARGSSGAGRLAAPAIARRLTAEIAVSDFVAARLERPPAAVIRHGVRERPPSWRSESRVVLLLQRLEAEKDTLTALRAWATSHLVEDGWRLRVVGEGAERHALERWVRERGVPGVTFAGWSDDADGELAAAGLLLTSAPADSFGLAVAEAMMAGVPVVAAAGGGHLETIGLVPGATLFPVGDADAAAAALRSLALDEAQRAALSRAGRDVALTRLGLARCVDEHVALYRGLGS
ncbi:MAG TPA: glycosyltransferase family 4 protein [Gaiellaceae bacterium]|nr:glycosyltransferase family 4 protein [Gaiellaceae bacterium]